MKLTNTPLIYSISRFSLGGLEFCLGRLSPPKPSRGGGSAWEYAKDIYTCSVDPGKVHDRVPHEKLWGVLREYGVDGRLLRQITVFLLTISVVVGRVKSQPFTVVLDSDKDVCCHHSSSYSTPGSPNDGPRSNPGQIRPAMPFHAAEKLLLPIMKKYYIHKKMC